MYSAFKNFSRGVIIRYWYPHTHQRDALRQVISEALDNQWSHSGPCCHEKPTEHLNYILPSSIPKAVCSN